MNDCDRIRKRLDHLAAGEPDGKIEDAMVRHLDGCPDCRRSLDAIESILQGAGEVRGDIAAALASVDWEATAERIADAAFAAPAARPAEGPLFRPFRGRLLRPRFRRPRAAGADFLWGFPCANVRPMYSLPERANISRQAAQFLDLSANHQVHPLSTFQRVGAPPTTT